MSELIHEHRIRCPWCGEAFSVLIDTSAGAQTYIEDCAVCCAPIELAVDAADGEVFSVDASQAN